MIIPMRDTYVLSSGDLSWLYANMAENSLYLIKGLLKRRLPAVDLRKYSRRMLSEAAIDLVRENDCIFSTSIHGTDYYGESLGIPCGDYERTISGFRAVVRGFTDSDVKAELKHIPQDRKNYLEVIDEDIRINESLRRKAQRRGSNYKVQRYSENTKMLKLLGKEVITIYKDVSGCARFRCLFKVQKNRRKARRENSMSKTIPVELGSSDGIFSLLLKIGSPSSGIPASKKIRLDYLSLNCYLQECNALYVTFPLRFMGWLPAGSYQRLLNEWEVEQDRDGIVRQLEPVIQEREFFERMITAFDDNVPKVCANRRPILEEIYMQYQDGRFPSCILLAITQLEGMLWDLGAYLNKKRKFVYKTDKSRGKTKYHPYEWDSAHKRYKKRKSTGYPAHNSHTSLPSARQLIERTRLREFLPDPVVSYMIDDFYDDRNELAHGRLRLLLKRETASYALLLLYSFMDCLSKIV
ncbi:hypothetical protein ACFL6S_25130 [Candidatus Poribacteria bacterium]